MAKQPLQNTIAPRSTSTSSRKRVSVAQLLRAFEDANISAARQMEDAAADDLYPSGKIRSSQQHGYESGLSRHARKSDD